MRKGHTTLAWSVIALTLFVNWGTPESSIDSTRRHPINFKGLLTTHDGRAIRVENIAIGGMYKDIAVYDMPAKSNAEMFGPKESDSALSPQTVRYKLTEDPHKGIITKIDLAEVSEIVVPHAKTMWVFKRKNGYRPLEFIEIEIISNDAKKTKNNYLVETSRKITCDQTNEAGPISKIIPFETISSLVLHGYSFTQPRTNNKNTTDVQQTSATQA